MELKTPHIRAARILKVLINVIIVVLAIFVIVMLVAAGLILSGSSIFDQLEGQVNWVDFLLLGGLAGAYLYVAFVVRAIVQTTVKGNPFVMENVSRLRITWIIIVLAEIFRIVLSALIKSDLSNCSCSPNLSNIEMPLQAWILALFIAIMAEVFRIGLELRRDQELTV